MGSSGRGNGARNPATVVVLRALQLGDLLCAVPAFRAMRRAWPSARMSLVGLPAARALTRRFEHYLDDFIEFPGYPGLPERPAEADGLPAFFDGLRARRYDLAIQMQGDGTITNDLVARFGAAAMAGFVPPGHAPRPDGVFVEYPDGHEIRKMLALAAALGAPAAGEHLEFPLSADDEREWGALRSAMALSPRGYVCLHPGARAAARRWPPEQFARVGEALRTRGLRVLVTGDGADEEQLAASVVDAMQGRATSVAGRTSLGALAALVRDARMIVCNDTGLSHVAAAVKTPSVVIFRITDPLRWAPLDAVRHRVVHDGPGAAVAAAATALGLLEPESAHAA